MKKETAEKIHSAVKALRQAIEEGTGSKKCIVLWGLVDNDSIPNGLSFGEELTYKEVAEIMLLINGRIYSAIDFD